MAPGGRARRRVCTPGGACNTYWKPGGLCSLRRAVAPGGVPGGVCVLPEELAILTGSPGGFVRSGELWRPEACPEACVYSRRSLRYLLESPGGFVRSGELWCPEACPEACVYSRRSLQYLLEARGLCSLRRAVAPGGVPGGVCVLPEELAILTGSPGGFVRSGELWRPEACVYSRRSLQYLLGARGALFAPGSCGARRRARRRVCTPGGACNTYWKPGGFDRSGELWRPEACPEACVYSRRSLRYLLEARGALFAPESCGARRRARRRVYTPGGVCNTYWKPGGFVRSGELWRPEACVYSRRSLRYLLEARGALFAPESCGARRRARRRVCTPGGACNTYWKPRGLCSLRSAVASGGVPGGVCVLPEEHAIVTGSPGTLFVPESCGARKRVCTPGGACNTYWKPGGLCSLRRAVAPGGVPGGVCVLPEELAILTGSPGGFVRSGELWRPEACPEACVYSRRSLQYLLDARGALFAPESCGARRRARRRVCTPGGACNTYWKPWGFVRSGELWRPEARPEACVYSRRSLQYLLEARGALFAPESCGARRRVCTPGGACNTYWEPGGLCSLRRAVTPGGVPGGVCVLPEELVVLTGSPGALYAPEDCGWPGGRCGLPDLGIPLQ